MNIKIKFITKRTAYWENRIIENAARVTAILNDDGFWASVHRLREFDLTDKTWGEIETHFKSIGDIEIRVGFYSKWFTKAIAYESGGDIFFNTRKSGAGSPGNIAHELCHALKYSHRGNAANGNENTLPYFLGNAVEKWARK